MTAFFKPNKKPFFLGVAGGSGSGKTFFAQELQKNLGISRCEIIYQDNFYLDQSKNFDQDGGLVNFDHPDSIEFSLLVTHLKKLRNGETTEIPTYDFVTHSRQKKTATVQPKQIIIVDGILIAHVAEVREQFDELVFFDSPEDLRFQRRLERDVKERGRAAAGVRTQFLNQVKPMHDQFVEPSKVHADIIVKDLEDFDIILKKYCAKLND